MGLKPATAWEPEQLTRPERVTNVQLLWDQRNFLAGLVLKAGVIAVIVSLLLPAKYRSTTRFVPSENSSGSLLTSLMSKASGSVGGLADLADAASLLGNKSPGALYLDIIGSRSMQDAIINKFDLRRVYRDRYYKDARLELAKNTHVEEDRKSGVITISVTDKDPHRAAQIAAAYLEEVSKLSNDLNTSAAHNERVFVEQRLATAKSDLELAEKNLSEFSTKNAAVDIPVQAKAMVEEAAILQGQLIAAQSELRGLQTIYTSNNVRVRSLRARIDEIHRQLEKIGGWTNQAPGAATQAQRDGDVEPELGGEQFYPTIRGLPKLGLAFADLYREVKKQETIYALLTQQYELAKIQEAREIPLIKVLDAPDVPEKRYSPSRILIVAFSLVAAFMIGSTWIIVRRLWLDTDDEDTRKRFLLYVVGTASNDVYKISRGRYGRSSPPPIS